MPLNNKNTQELYATTECFFFNPQIIIANIIANQHTKMHWKI